MQTRRATGQLGDYFARTRDTVARFVRIAQNLWGVLSGVLRVARPLGNQLWASFERITAGWDDWVNSVQGQQDLFAWFQSLRPTLTALGRLTGDLAAALFRMSGPESQRQAAGIVNQMRDWVPILERVFRNLS